MTLIHHDRVEYIAIADLQPYAGNARTRAKKQIQQIAKSIERYGFTNPVLIDDRNGIVAGHGRVLAARSIRHDGGALPAPHAPVGERKTRLHPGRRQAHLEAGSARSCSRSSSRA